MKLQEMKPRSNLRLPQSETVMVPGHRGPLAEARFPKTRNSRCSGTKVIWAVCCGALLKLSSPLCLAEETTPLPPPAAVSPEELLRSLSRCGKPDWASKFRAPSAVALNSRVQIALVLGGVFADGYLAAQAEDGQQCRNIGKDLLRLSKTLGVHTELLDRSRSIADSAQNKDWANLRRELQATEADLGAALRKHEDEALARLVSLGAWMRSTEIIASLLSDHYSENAASLLRQPALGLLLGRGLEKLGDKLEADPAIDLIRPKLHTVERLLNASADTPPSHGEVKEIATVLTSILRDVNEKPH
jgi:hypothetical protein